LNISLDAIREFLKIFRDFTKHYRFFIWSRRDSLQTLTDLGISIEDFKRMLCNLTPHDCYSGPHQDTQYNYLECWVFKMTIQGKILYVRLQVDWEEKVAICQSVHPPKYPMK